MSKSITIKAEGDFLEVTVLRYAYPDANNIYDKNWLYVLVHLKVGAFSGKYNSYFQTNDFFGLRDNLILLYKDLSFQFDFKPLEEQLQLAFSGDGMGHIKVTGKAQDEAGTGNVLSFVLHFDQTSIPLLIQQADELIKEFLVT